MSAPDFDRLLVPGTRIEGRCGPGTIGQPERAELGLPSGHLVASAFRWEPVAFTEIAPPGRYPVLLYPLLGAGRPISAAVKLVIRDEPVTAWSMALLPGQDPAVLNDIGWFGFPVDGGEASLIDAQHLREVWAAGEFQEFVDDAVSDLGFGGLIESTEDDEGRDMVAFSTGDGDGSYPTWVGRTATGELACFVVDFLLLA